MIFLEFAMWAVLSLVVLLPGYILFLMGLEYIQDIYARSERSRAARPQPPADHAPASLLRWAAMLAEGAPDSLAKLARAQAGIDDWEGAAKTLRMLERCCFKKRLGSTLPPFGELRLAATRWTCNQIRIGNNPPEALDYVSSLGRQRPSPEDLLFLEKDPIEEFSPIPPDHFDHWADHDPQKWILKAAWAGRFEEARTLVRNCDVSSYTNAAQLLCQIARAQIALRDLEGAKQTLRQAYESAMTLEDNDIINGDYAEGDVPSLRQGALAAVAIRSAQASDFASAQRIFEMLRNDAAIDRAACGIAITYARIGDLRNAARMISHIGLARRGRFFPRYEEPIADVTIDAVRVFRGEPMRKTTWPYSPGYMLNVYRYATGV